MILYSFYLGIFAEEKYIRLNTLFCVSTEPWKNEYLLVALYVHGEKIASLRTIYNPGYFPPHLSH